MKLLSILVLGVLLFVSALFAIYAGLLFSGVSMSIHGWIAMGLGAFLTTALGAGLMALVFVSARKGFDDQQSVAMDAEIE